MTSLVCASDIMLNEQDLTNIVWSFDKNSPGTAGMYLKGRGFYKNSTYFLKLSAYNAHDGVYGQESVFEVIAQRVANLLGINYLKVWLLNAKVVIDGKELKSYISCSKDYRVSGEVRVSFESLYQLESEGLSTQDFILSSKMQPYRFNLLGMLVLDYIIYNRDRHSNNIEFLFNPNTNSYRLAPIMDHGCCLTSILYDKWKEKSEDYFLVDSPVNNCIGSYSLLSNLKEICKGNICFDNNTVFPDDLLVGLESILGEEHYNFILNMLKRRWQNALEVLNS